MVSANSIDRFTPDCGNEFAGSAFLTIPSAVRLRAEVANLGLYIDIEGRTDLSDWPDIDANRPKRT